MPSESQDIERFDEDDATHHAHFMYELLGHELCGITELRALGDGNPCVAYVNNSASFVELALGRNRHGDDVYVGLQPRPASLSRDALNTWRPARGGKNRNVATADDIEYVMNVAVDIDASTAERSAGHPASDAELAVCAEVGRRIGGMEGFAGTAAVALTGNGVHVLNPVTPARVHIATPSALKTLERRWIGEAGALPSGIRIDRIMDLPRIVRVIGTMNFKGNPKHERPHRRSRFLAMPTIGGRQHLIAEHLKKVVSQRAESEYPRCFPATMEGELRHLETCAFVRWIMLQAPRIPEPAWMDFLMQCAWLEGGDAVAHQVSARDAKRYSHEETQARLERIRRMGYRPKSCQNLLGERGLFNCPRMDVCGVRHPIDLALRGDPPHRPSCRPRPEPYDDNL